MKVTLQSTTKIVDLIIEGTPVPARVWEGFTANGVPCHAYVIRIAVSEADDASEFDRDLAAQAVPTPAIAALPMRMIL